MYETPLARAQLLALPNSRMLGVMRSRSKSFTLRPRWLGMLLRVLETKAKKVISLSTENFFLLKILLPRSADPLIEAMF